MSRPVGPGSAPSRHRSRRTRAPAIALFPILCAACTVGPDYEPPDLTPTVPDAWRAAVVAEMTSDTASLQRWWEAFGDTALTGLIRRAELANRDLAAAVGRVEEARALRGVAKGGLLPDVVLDGSYTRFRLSENGLQGGALGGETLDQWNGGLSLSWEIDLFGRVRRGVEAASAELSASVEDYRDVLVTLYAEVASAYVDIRTFQQRLAFARANAEAQRRSLQLTRDRFRAGLTSGLDVAQAESNLATTEAQIPSLEDGLNRSFNRLSVLLGEPPGDLQDELAAASPIPAPSGEIAALVPADLLRRRPDIRRAERRLAAQTARIGIATADLYPSFSLTGFLGLESLDFENLGDEESVGWSLVPGFRWNLFSGGKIRNRIRAEEARTRQALAAYEQTILLALEDVGNSLVAYGRERDRRARLSQAVQASERSVAIVETQYRSGLTDFQRYLDSQRSLFSQQDALAVSAGQVTKNLIAVNRALGGGWDPDAAEPDGAATARDAQSAAGQGGGTNR
jgi:NodT family efflux transporter outer membrane factor (OMF) lipoprotein